VNLGGKELENKTHEIPSWKKLNPHLYELRENGQLKAQIEIKQNTDTPHNRWNITSRKAHWKGVISRAFHYDTATEAKAEIEKVIDEQNKTFQEKGTTGIEYEINTENKEFLVSVPLDFSVHLVISAKNKEEAEKRVQHIDASDFVDDNDLYAYLGDAFKRLRSKMKIEPL